MSEEDNYEFMDADKWDIDEILRDKVKKAREEEASANRDLRESGIENNRQAVKDALYYFNELGASLKHIEGEEAFAFIATFQLQTGKSLKLAVAPRAVRKNKNENRKSMSPDLPVSAKKYGAIPMVFPVIVSTVKQSAIA